MPVLAGAANHAYWLPINNDPPAQLGISC